jgi:hypothetical protein
MAQLGHSRSKEEDLLYQFKYLLGALLYSFDQAPYATLAYQGRRMRKLVFPCLFLSTGLLAVAISGVQGISGTPSGITVSYLTDPGRIVALVIAVLLAACAFIAWKMGAAAFWKAARITALLTTGAIVLLPSTPFVDWRLSVIFGLSGSGALFLWLSMMRLTGGVDWSAPYAWSAPFFPATKYPLRFWIVNSYATLIGGIVGESLAAVSWTANASVSLMLLITGAFLLLTVHIWMWLFLGPRGQLG